MTDRNITVGDATAFILRASRVELDALNEAMKARYRNLRTEANIAAVDEFEVDDRVALTGLSPKYVNGSRGTIVGRSGVKFKVELDDECDPRVVNRFGKTLTVPGAALKAVA